jgi:polyhydroxyalkanoate synthesis regulator phasin
MESSEMTPLIDHLVRQGLSTGDARRIVSDVLAYFSEDTEEFVRRRHRELQHAGLPNTETFRVIAAELSSRRVAAPQLTERQIRRLIYG